MSQSALQIELASAVVAAPVAVANANAHEVVLEPELLPDAVVVVAACQQLELSIAAVVE